MTGMEIDLLGEVYNIAMGAASHILSSLLSGESFKTPYAFLSRKSDIKTAKTEVVKSNDFVFIPNVPSWGVEIKYTSGLVGTNVLVLKQSDIVKIVHGLFRDGNTTDEPAELDEMYLDAIKEVVNQMMGQIEVTLSKFLEIDIAISVTQVFKIKGDYNIGEVAADDMAVANRFNFIVDDLIDSEMIIVLSVPFAKEILIKAKKAFGVSNE